MKLSVALLLLAVCFCVGNAYKILVIFPMPGRSHSILGNAVVDNLAKAGHEITYITSMPRNPPPKNVRQIDVSDNFNYLPIELLTIKTIMAQQKSMNLGDIMNFMLQVQNKTFHNPNVRELLLDRTQHFDLVIPEWMFSESYAAFGAIFNAPYVWVSTVEPHWMVLRLIDENCSPAYTTDSMNSAIPPFTFKERVTQLFGQIFIPVWKKIFAESMEQEIYSSLTPYFNARGLELPSFNQIIFNASLMLGNSHVSLGQATKLPQSYKAVGGYHINPEVAPLPVDLKNLLDNAKDGVIYFSMGSNVKSKDLPDEVKASLLKMFSTLKQTIIWKFEEALPGAPKNVHVIKWAPQQSILAHPNCILFITHGGLLSTTETIHYAKPIIGIPVFADQFSNVDRAVIKGFAKRVDLSFNMADDLKAAIVEIIQDPKYTNKVKELSFIYHDRPVSPAKELVHWVEHVIKTGGAPHLRSPALYIAFYQKMYLDLLALIIAICYAIKAIFRRIFRKTNKKQKTQ